MSLNITCPICGVRNGYEFRYGGEDRGPRPHESTLTPEAWCRYVHLNRSVAGVQREWWVHREGCGLWFRIDRDTRRNMQVREPASDRREEGGE